MCDVWVRVRLCENRGMFIYGTCVCEREKHRVGQDCACVSSQTPVYLRAVSLRLGL